MSKLLTYTEAAEIASQRLRRPISRSEVASWPIQYTVVDGENVVRAEWFGGYLDAVEAELKLLTIPEAAARVQTMHKRPVSYATVRAWCVDGYLKQGKRLRLPCTPRPGHRRGRLIDPVELDRYVREVVPPASARPVGCPLGKRRKKP